MNQSASPSRGLSAPTLRRLLWWAAVPLSCLYLFFVGILPAFSQWAPDLRIYYEAGQRLRAGLDLYTDLGARGPRPLIGSWFLYPPSYAAFMAPFTYLPFRAVQWIWQLGYLALLVYLASTTARLLRRMDPHRLLLPAGLSILCWMAATPGLLIDCQADLITACLLVAALDLRMRGFSPWWSALLIAAAANLKVLPAVFLLLFALRGEWRVALGGAGLSLLFFCMAIPLAGWANTREFLFEIMPKVMRYGDIYGHNQSLFTLFGYWLGGPNASSRLLSSACGFGLLAAGGLSAYHARAHQHGLLLGGGLFLCLLPLLSTISWPTAYIACFFPLAMAGTLWLNAFPRQPLWGLVWVVAMGLLATLPHVIRNTVMPYQMNFHYLAAALLLFVLLLRFAWAQKLPPPSHTTPP